MMKETAPIRLSFLLLLTALLFSVAAQATNLTVNCSAKKNNSINAALVLLSKQGPHTITISGMCNESVFIEGFDSLTLMSSTGASINDPTPIVPDDNDIVDIVSSRNVTLQGLTLNGGATGFFCGQFSSCTLTDVNVQFAAFSGVTYNRSGGFILGNTVIEDNGATSGATGLVLVNAANVVLNQATFPGGPAPTIQSNGGHGIQVSDNSTLVAAGVTIQFNGFDGVTSEPGGAASIRLLGCTITQNGGNGVHLRSSAARFQQADLGSGPIPNTITANGGDGVRINSLSLARFQGAFPTPHTITGNGSGTDINCVSPTGLTLGSLSGNVLSGPNTCTDAP
jgi:hypothetical protein